MLRSRSTHLLCVRWGRGLPDLDNSALIDIRVHCFDGICVSFRYLHTHTHRSSRTLAISLNTLTPNALFRYVYIYLFTYTIVLLFLVSSYVFTKINGMESSLGQATRQTQSWKWSKLVFTWFLFGKRFSLKIFLVYLLSAKVRHCPLMGLYICMCVCVYNVKLLYMGLRMEIVLH